MIPIHQLSRGECVMLHCPSDRRVPRHEAMFEGVFHSLAEALADIDETNGVVPREDRQPWARFLMGMSHDPELEMHCVDGTKHRVRNPGAVIFFGVFAINPDGSMVDLRQRAIYVEARLA